jgi:predicted ATPase
VQALRDLIRQIITENETKVQIWKDKILLALGENGQVIIEVIPELERIIGKQPAIPELFGTAAQNRFNHVSLFINIRTRKGFVKGKS